MKVLNMGSLNYDYVYAVDHMVVEGETQASSRMDTFCGGKGLNQSIALAKAGVFVYHAGLVGEDGQLLMETCKKYGVDTTFVRSIPGKSGHAIIQLDWKGQNCILLYGGSNRRFTKDYVDEVLDAFESGDLLLLQNEINEMGYIVDRASAKGMNIILNPSPYNDELKQVDMNKISIFLVNEIEGAQITGTEKPEEMLEAMRKNYPGARVVLTLGKDGAIYQDEKRRCRQEIFPVKAVDTTAAGDTFTGYFIAGLLEGMPIEEIMKRCARASAIAVSRKGAAQSIPFPKELEEQSGQAYINSFTPQS